MSRSSSISACVCVCVCVCTRANICWMKSVMTKTSSCSYNRRQNPGSLLQPRNNLAVLSVEEPFLSVTEESKASQVKRQEHFFLIYTMSACSLGMCSSRSVFPKIFCLQTSCGYETYPSILTSLLT